MLKIIQLAAGCGSLAFGLIFAITASREVINRTWQWLFGFRRKLDIATEATFAFGAFGAFFSGLVMVADVAFRLAGY